MIDIVIQHVFLSPSGEYVLHIVQHAMNQIQL